MRKLPDLQQFCLIFKNYLVKVQFRCPNYLHYVSGIIMLCKNDRHVKKLLVCKSLLNYTRTQSSIHIVSSLSAFVKSVIISNFLALLPSMIWPVDLLHRWKLLFLRIQ